MMTEIEEEESKYSFDEEFQRKIAACILKSKGFNDRTVGLIRPEYFENAVQAAVVNCCLRYYKNYGSTPSLAALVELIKEDAKSKIIRKDVLVEIVEGIREKNGEIHDLYKESVTHSDESYIVDQVATFARHKAMEQAIFKYADLIDKGDYDRAAKVIADASSVSANKKEDDYNLFGEKEISERESYRNDRALGISEKSDVVTSGVRALDKRLYHKGWGKKELYVMMAPPKAGKSISLAFFAKNAALSGKNVLFVTLEVSKLITTERLDSSISGVAMDKLEKNIIDVREKIKRLAETSGVLMVEEYPTGTFTPNMLSRTIQDYKTKGIVFDMVVVDYADIMRPNNVTNDPIENSRSIYVDLRAMAQIENVVMLTAMQTNREGAKSIVAKMEHAASDFNKIRIPDLVISINRTEEEAEKGEARLFFAASRNQAGEFSIHVSQELECMNFIKEVLGVST